MCSRTAHLGHATSFKVQVLSRVFCALLCRTLWALERTHGHEGVGLPPLPRPDAQTEQTCSCTDHAKQVQLLLTKMRSQLPG